MIEKETNRKKKKNLQAQQEGGMLNKLWCSHLMEYCATIEMMFTEGL